jgi:hypothetical protein
MNLSRASLPRTLGTTAMAAAAIVQLSNSAGQRQRWGKMETLDYTIVVLRSRRAPFVAFAIILVPVILLSSFVIIRAQDMKGVIGPISIAVILFGFWWYLYSLKLILDERTIKYEVLWHKREISIDEIESITRKPMIFGLSSAWLIKRHGKVNDMVINVTNFMPYDIKKFVRSLKARAPGIRLIGVPS